MGRHSQSESRWEHTIPALFAAQARERPDAVAVSCCGEHVTYGELDERSDRIAGWLAAQGVGVEDVVAVQLERGHDLVAALLGIAKAGAVYLSLEPGAPQARLEEVVAAAGPVAPVTGHDGPAVA